MHYPMYPYAMSMTEQAEISDITTMTILLTVVFGLSVYLIRKINQ